jgi:hypothetical protein
MLRMFAMEAVTVSDALEMNVHVFTLVEQFAAKRS